MYNNFEIMQQMAFRTMCETSDVVIAGGDHLYVFASVVRQMREAGYNSTDLNAVVDTFIV